MFKHIEFATDGSEHSRKALDYAVDLAKRYQAQVIVVHVYPDVSDMLGEPVYDQLVSHRVLEGNKIIDETINELAKAGIKTTRELLSGSPAEAILNVADTRGCDLIVMGARGLSDLQGLLLGSVSHQVIQHAKCPVMVIR